MRSRFTTICLCLSTTLAFIYLLEPTSRTHSALQEAYSTLGLQNLSSMPRCSESQYIQSLTESPCLNQTRQVPLEPTISESLSQENSICQSLERRKKVKPGPTPILAPAPKAKAPLYEVPMVHCQASNCWLNPANLCRGRTRMVCQNGQCRIVTSGQVQVSSVQVQSLPSIQKPTSTSSSTQKTSTHTVTKSRYSSGLLPAASTDK